MQPFVLVSDIHLHNFTQFDRPTEHGHGTRVEHTLQALLEAAQAARTVNINRMVIAGDIFHVRGKLSPSVVNPFRDTLDLLVKSGFTIEMIPGNHDLETENSYEHSSAIQFLRTENLVKVYSHPTITGDDIYFIPWTPDLNELKELLQAPPDTERCDLAVVMHAPVNGVIPGLPDTGLDPAWLTKLGYKAIFSGHYHRHVDFSNNVYSIGALNHHNFGDVGTKAGYMIVRDSGVLSIEQHETQAPRFVDHHPDLPHGEYAGHYVRATLTDSTITERERFRDELLNDGALGVMVRNVKTAPEYRTGESSERAASSEGLLDIAKSYINERYPEGVQAERVYKQVERLLTKAEEATP